MRNAVSGSSTRGCVLHGATDDFTAPLPLKILRSVYSYWLRAATSTRVACITARWKKEPMLLRTTVIPALA
jgi:hypothetical protein